MSWSISVASANGKSQTEKNETIERNAKEKKAEDEDEEAGTEYVKEKKQI